MTRRFGMMLMAALAVLPIAALGASLNVQVYGLTSDQSLISFETRSPRDAIGVGMISGLDTDTKLVGIDFRPATGELYGLGDAGGVYTIDVTTASATLKSRLNMALSGTAFGLDFNPTVDRLRIVSDAGQNLRANVDTGATTKDLDLLYTGPATGVAGAAYTNNDADTNTGTTLFDLDSDLDQIAIQAPPNNGSLNVVGKLLSNTSSDAGFDIYTVVRDGQTTDNLGLATLTVDGRARLFEINLLTGAAKRVGSFPRDFQVVDIAAPMNQ